MLPASRHPHLRISKSNPSIYCNDGHIMVGLFKGLSFSASYHVARAIHSNLNSRNRAPRLLHLLNLFQICSVRTHSICWLGHSTFCSYVFGLCTISVCLRLDFDFDPVPSVCPSSLL